MRSPYSGNCRRAALNTARPFAGKRLLDQFRFRLIFRRERRLAIRAPLTLALYPEGDKSQGERRKREQIKRLDYRFPLSLRERAGVRGVKYVATS
jgi:hypothetical protein